MSLVGVILGVGGVSGFAFFLLVDLLPGPSNAYSLINMVPALSVAALGALLVLVGVLREAARRRRGARPSLSGETLDLTVLTRRFGRLVAALTAVVTLGMLSIGMVSTRLYDWSESNIFCGETCHSVMEPEWTTYHTSPHSQVDCVECHVGPKVGSYVATKANGLRQLLAVIRGHVERPITTPIRNMRPAREICEQCHAAGRFVAYQDEVRSYYLADAGNTPLRVRMLTKIGGGGDGLLEGAGIHYHMVVAKQIEYVARDPKRQEIRWVRVTDGDQVTTFQDADDPLDEDEIGELEVRTMDCLDCHNRPAHRFPAPVDLVNAALARGTLSRDLPFIKREAVVALSDGYATREEALEGIRSHLLEFYEEEHPEVLEAQAAQFEQSVETVQALYRGALFPEMRASWTAHPDNIGHRDSPGCFRCHNDRMESEDGEAIVTECRLCHVILAQGEDVGKIDTDLERGEPFVHPEDFESIEEYTECVDCHTGGGELYE